VKLRIVAVQKDFHSLLVATKLLTASYHSSYIKESESEISERSKSVLVSESV